MKSSGHISHRSKRVDSEKIGRTLETTMHRRTYHILRCVDQDPYSEWYGEYIKRKSGFRGCKKSRIIWPWQVRMYRTWKHNRKTQWKKKLTQ